MFNIKDKILSVFILILLLFWSANHLSAQEHSPFDALVINKTYSIVLFDDKEITGKLVSNDSLTLTFRDNNSTIIVKKQDIFSIRLGSSSSKYSAIFQLGAGVTILSGEYYNSYSGRGDNVGLNIGVNTIFPFNESKGIRLDFEYSKLHMNEPDVYPVSYEFGFTGYPKPKIDYYSFKVNFILGTLKPSDKFIAFGNGGIGVQISHEEPYSYTTYYSYDSSYHTYSYEGTTYANMLLALGGGVAYRFSKQIGIFTDVQFNMLTASGYFFFFGPGSFRMKAGVSYFIF